MSFAHIPISHNSHGRRDGLIITADDFGLHPSINEAVERAHRDGVLTAASLMVSSPATADAVARAKRMPQLRVGLHLVLADGSSILPREQIPDLVTGTEPGGGHFGDDMARDGFRFFFLPRVRQQLAAEIRAQFEAFAATGLPLDHVNAHKHFHLHPTVLTLMLKIGRDYDLRAVRFPAETGAAIFLRPWLALLRRRLDASGIGHNDQVCGIAHSGKMDETTLLHSLRELRSGITEIYLHPATRNALMPAMQHYRHTDELAALLSPRVRQLLETRGIKRGGFSDFFGP